MGIVVARLKSCPSEDHRVGGTLVCGRSCGTQGPSTALRFGRDDRVVSLFGDGRVSARWKSLWQCRLPPLHRTQRWGTPRFGLGGKEPCAEILRWDRNGTTEVVSFPRSSGWRHVDPRAVVWNTGSLHCASLRSDDRVISLC